MDDILAGIAGVWVLSSMFFLAGVYYGNPRIEKKITTGKTIVINNGSYRCKMTKILKEEK